MSIIREYLMTQKGYTPYCRNMHCRLGMPRTSFDGEQFRCRCGWRSEFDKEFIDEYRKKWNININKMIATPPLDVRRSFESVYGIQPKDEKAELGMNITVSNYNYD